MSGNECGKVEQQIQKYNNTSSSGFLPASASDELGVECRCGCVVHMSKATRTLSATTKGCPGRSFWLIKVNSLITLNNMCIFLYYINKPQKINKRNILVIEESLTTQFYKNKKFLLIAY